jgi:3-deoxy-D-manno-octulosonate 8-phosphate phosphatase (KDO 8-P phosphatase)
MSDASERARGIRLMGFDVDGVMTDGTLFMIESGEEIKAFNVLDGHGIKMLAASGVAIAIVSARKSRAVERRAQTLGINHVLQGIEDKRTAFSALARDAGLALSQCGFIGDDVLDLPLLRSVGFAASVPNAPAFVQQHVHFVTRARGGTGAVRELCEYIMQAQGSLERALARYLQ